MGEPLSYSADDATSRALAAADPAMGRLIERIRAVEFASDETPFAVLARSIIGQQLSDVSARAIVARAERVVGLTPDSIAAASHETLRSAGLSTRKAEYLSGLAREVLSGGLDLEELRELDDEQVADRLMKVRGIGRWTADMFLLFALKRPDVVALGDAGIRGAAGRLLNLGRSATASELEAAADRWRPYRSAAMLYLYRDAVPVDGAPRASRR